MKSVTLRTLRRQLRRKVRNRNNTCHRRNLKMVSDYCNKWGENTVVYEESKLREYTADSISARLGLPQPFVLDRLNMFHRMANYEQEADH